MLVLAKLSSGAGFEAAVKLDLIPSFMSKLWHGELVLFQNLVSQSGKGALLSMSVESDSKIFSFAKSLIARAFLATQGNCVLAESSRAIVERYSGWLSEHGISEASLWSERGVYVKDPFDLEEVVTANRERNSGLTNARDSKLFPYAPKRGLAERLQDSDAYLPVDSYYGLMTSKAEFKKQVSPDLPLIELSDVFSLEELDRSLERLVNASRLSFKAGAKVKGLEGDLTAKAGVVIQANGGTAGIGTVVLTGVELKSFRDDIAKGLQRKGLSIQNVVQEILHSLKPEFGFDVQPIHFTPLLDVIVSPSTEVHWDELGFHYASGLRIQLLDTKKRSEYQGSIYLPELLSSLSLTELFEREVKALIRYAGEVDIREPFAVDWIVVHWQESEDGPAGIKVFAIDPNKRLNGSWFLLSCLHMLPEKAKESFKSGELTACNDVHMLIKSRILNEGGYSCDEYGISRLLADNDIPIADFGSDCPNGVFFGQPVAEIERRCDGYDLLVNLLFLASSDKGLIKVREQAIEVLKPEPDQLGYIGFIEELKVLVC